MNRLTRQAFFLTVEKAAHLLGGMVLMVVVARLLGAAALGVYAYVIAMTSVFVPVLDAGLNTRVIRGVASGGGQHEVGDAVAFKLRMGFVVLALMLALAWWAGKPFSVLGAVCLVGISTWAMSLGDAFNAVFKGKQQAHKSALLVGITYGCLTLSGIGAMVAGWGVLGIAVFYALCRMGFLWGGWVLLRRVDLHPEWFAPLQWPRVVVGLRFMPAIFFIGVVLNVNFVTLDWLADGEQVGLYAIGYRVGAALFVLASASMEGVLSALVQVRGAAFYRLFAQACGLLVGVGVLGIGLVYLLGHWAVLWIFGAAYLGAVEAVLLLGWILPPLLLCTVSHTALLALGCEREAFLWMLVFVCVGSLWGVLGFWWAGFFGVGLAPTVSGWLFAILLCGRVLKVVQEMNFRTG